MCADATPGRRRLRSLCGELGVGPGAWPTLFSSSFRSPPRSAADVAREAPELRARRRLNDAIQSRRVAMASSWRSTLSPQSPIPRSPLNRGASGSRGTPRRGSRGACCTRAEVRAQPKTSFYLIWINPPRRRVGPPETTVTVMRAVPRSAVTVCTVRLPHLATTSPGPLFPTKPPHCGRSSFLPATSPDSHRAGVLLCPSWCWTSSCWAPRFFSLFFQCPLAVSPAPLASVIEIADACAACSRRDSDQGGCEPSMFTASTARRSSALASWSRPLVATDPPMRPCLERRNTLCRARSSLPFSRPPAMPS